MTAVSILLDQLEQTVSELPAVRPLVLAYSGGVDSSVLLEGLVRAGLGSNELLPVHVHHGLSPHADDWAEHCRRRAAAHGLEARVERVAVEAGSNLEARARAARYDALLRHAPPGGVLMLAHHQDDQAETLLLRLLRGAGVRGLTAMRPLERRNGYCLARPLLALSRETIEAAAREWELDWITDPANTDPGPDRNFLRHRVRPMLAERWPAVDSRLAATTEAMDEAAGLLDERAEEDFAACAGRDKVLSLCAFRSLNAARQRNLLHWWCRRRGLRPPERRFWDRLEPELLDAAVDRQPRLEWPEGCLTRFGGGLHLLRPDELEPVTTRAVWHLAVEPSFSFGPFRLQQRPDEEATLRLCPGVDTLRLAPLDGGERLLRNGQHQRVVELWREAGVPPWQRKRLPLLYAGDALVAVAGIGVADDWQPAPGDAGIAIGIREAETDRAL